MAQTYTGPFNQTASTTNISNNWRMLGPSQLIGSTVTWSDPLLPADHAALEDYLAGLAQAAVALFSKAPLEHWTAAELLEAKLSHYRETLPGRLQLELVERAKRERQAEYDAWKDEQAKRWEVTFRQYTQLENKALGYLRQFQGTSAATTAAPTTTTTTSLWRTLTGFGR